MELCNKLNDCCRVMNSIISVGTYDGIHLAHAAIIENVIKISKETGYKSTIVTFDPHPRLVVQPKNGKTVKLLTSIDEKVKLFKNFGIDRLVIIPFDKEFSQFSPEKFVKEILFEKIGFKKLIVGFDHAFGRDRSGNIDFLKDIGKTIGFEVEILDAIKDLDGKISSTRIRKLIENGAIKSANSFLGRPYQLSGEVVKGSGRGSSISVPTANIKLQDENKCLPANGVYIVETILGNDVYNGIMNFGIRPTFGENINTIEVHIFEFDNNIYGKNISVNILDYIREEKKFNSVDNLVAQINKDINYAKNYFKEEKMVG